VPPTTKPQVKKAEEGKEKKTVKAVAVVLLLLLVVAFVDAQNATRNVGTGNKTGNADKVAKDIESWAVGGAGLMVTIFGAMFWAAVGIILFHLAVSYIAPTRFQRLSSMWDAIERAKDIAIGFAVAFGIFYGIMAAAAAISGEFTTEKAWELFTKIVSKPLNDLYKQVFK
jgi:uncharacterized membrane protein YidH (DUF202 family)